MNRAANPAKLLEKSRCNFGAIGMERIDPSTRPSVVGQALPPLIKSQFPI